MTRDLIGAVMVAVSAFFILRMVLAWRSRVSSGDAHKLVEEGAILLDVRSPAEVANGCLPGARNIPVQALAGRLGELEKERKIVVYCASGMRSAKAASLLKSEGFDAHDLGPISAWGKA